MAMTKKITHLAEKGENKKSTVEQSDLCDLEQVTLKPQLQVHHYLSIWLQIWYHSLLMGDSFRKGADLEEEEVRIRRPPRGTGELSSSAVSVK